ncbi:hypothetical protein vBCbaSRXM_106 [Citromicrobium phage vB_CbaS-RXM]|nr:hypothetical protein vBCbaSRXM_106 [Citromicrobium phage vB_CbaS-RXM]
MNPVTFAKFFWLAVAIAGAVAAEYFGQSYCYFATFVGVYQFFKIEMIECCGAACLAAMTAYENATDQIEFADESELGPMAILDTPTFAARMKSFQDSNG